MINKLVPPKNDAKLPLTPNLEMNAGRIAMIAKNTEPGNVIFVKILSIKSAVCLPGRIPE